MENKELKIKDLEAKLWKSADALRGNLSAEDYMHVVLDIITLKYLNDKYKKSKEKLINDGFSEDILDKGLLMSENAFVITEKSSWKTIMNNLFKNEIGLALDDALVQLAKDNEELSDIFIAQYNDKDIDKTRLSEVVKIFDDIDISEFGEDILGRVYEYFLGEFFLKRGQKGGEFYTPKSIVKLIAAILKPVAGTIYDPACGSGGMLIQAKNYIENNGGDLDRISVWGQEFNRVTRNLAKLNLILNGFQIKLDDNEYALGVESADTFTNDQHKHKIFDYIMANPPFNLKSYWNDSLVDDKRWKYGLPPKNNANFAWLQHILSKLSVVGKAGVVLANGSLTSTQSNEDEIRKNIINDNKISCIVALPDKLFFTTGISACIWFFDNNKSNKDILFIDVQNLGTLIDGSKKNKEITDENIKVISDIYDRFASGEQINISGLARSVSSEEVAQNEYSLLPGKYIEIEKDKEEKDPKLIKQELKHNIDELLKLMEESKELEKELFKAIKKLDLDNLE
ncbi:MAG: type I restriction-modification system subunit M [Ureaplasma sp.]|nr:type I restriction-modification system subunit M [Ureaplasma sp.]